jgi:hypothetical protein
MSLAVSDYSSCIFYSDYPAWLTGRLDVAKILKNTRELSGGVSQQDVKKAKKPV